MLVAAAQFCASNEISKNQDIIGKLIQNASLKNASLICFLFKELLTNQRFRGQLDFAKSAPTAGQ